MVRELDAMGVKTMVSIWPTVAPAAETFHTMKEQGFLVRAERGLPVFIPFVDADPLGPHPWPTTIRPCRRRGPSSGIA
jgi:alpha-D-xyloside xylohydrolase